jgi:transposase
MDRFILTDAQWAKMEPHCLGKPTDPGRTGSDNRMFLEAVLWIARTGSPGETFLRCLAIGIQSSPVFAIG